MTKLLIRNPSVVLREEDTDGALLFNPDTNKVYVINRTGVFLWHHCDGSLDRAALIEKIDKSFEDLSDNVNDEIQQFLDLMEQQHLIGLVE